MTSVLVFHVEGDVTRVRDQVSADLLAWQARYDSVLGPDSPLVPSLEALLQRCQETALGCESGAAALCETAGARLETAEALLLEAGVALRVAQGESDRRSKEETEASARESEERQRDSERRERELQARLSAAEAGRDAADVRALEAVSALKTSREETARAEAGMEVRRGLCLLTSSVESLVASSPHTPKTPPSSPPET